MNAMLFLLLNITILSLFFPLQGISKELNIYAVEKEIDLPAGGSGTIVLNVEIPKKQHIYGNPKGPGVGRPTTIEVTHTNNIIFKSIKFAAPKKYIAPGDTDYVWIYEDNTSIHIPFKIYENSNSGKYKISLFVQALICSDKACTLHEFTVKYTANITQSEEITNNKKNYKLITTELLSLPSEKISAANSKINAGNLSKKLLKFKARYLSELSVSSIIQAILYGILAGFILNFMPCVLPVISLKIMDIIKHSGDDRKEIQKMGIIFSLGIIATFVFLASLAAFLGYSWGGLFQKSIFLIVMIAIVFIFTLSMFEVFIINIPIFAGKASQGISNKYVQAFSKGLLATLLATPCSGPFLGGTLAWASTQPPFVVFLIFISVGVGMSMPYIILTTNPRLMKFIPKPGDWMVTFENIMAFLLLATTLYLIGILKQSLIMPTLWFLLFITVAFWQYGKFGSIIMAKNKRIISRMALIIIILFGYLFSYNYLYEEEDTTLVSMKKDFQLSQLFDNNEIGKISIVEFTADWCPNCKLVEKTSLYTSKVKKAMKNNNIELYIADLTRENPKASALLNKLGSSSIPFLAIFPAGKSFYNPVCLRDIYSEEDVLNAITHAK